MNRLTLIAAGCALVGVAFGQRLEREAFEAQNDPPAVVQWAQGHRPEFAKAGGARPVSLLLNHGGPVLVTTVTKAIFWGTSWPSDSSDKISGINSFYIGVGGSAYAGTNTEFSGSNGQVTTAITHDGHVIDGSSAPSGAPSTGVILGEVCKAIPAGSRRANGFYAVYVDQGRGNAGYCAWHSAGHCGDSDQTPFQFAFFFKLDGDGGCDPGDNSTGHSQGLAAIANVSGHELSEAMTDPQLNAWYDRQGAENSDKCAWTFGRPSLTFANGTHWKVQGNFSNAAYNAKTGYDHAGCIDGN